MFPDDNIHTNIFNHYTRFSFSLRNIFTNFKCCFISQTLQFKYLKVDLLPTIVHTSLYLLLDGLPPNYHL